MATENLQVLRMREKLSHSRSSVNRNIQLTEHPEADVAKAFMYALRSHYRRFGVRQAPTPYSSDDVTAGTVRYLARECAVEFHGRLYHLNTHNLGILTIPRRVLDKRVDLPDGLTRGECKMYCDCLDKNTFDDTLARRSANVAIWVLERLQ